LRYRLAAESDLETCRTLLHPGCRLGAGVGDKLVDLWAKLLASGALTFSIIEDPRRAHPDGIKAFGASVFVTDPFAEEFSRTPLPYLSGIIYQRIVAGRSPVLTRRQVRDANSSSGLNLVVLHFGLRNHDMANDETQRALQVGSAAFFFLHAGYQLKVLLNEVYGRQQADFMTAGGAGLRIDFAESSRPELVHLPREHHPYLFIQRKESMTPAAVNPLSYLFHSPRPQFGFSPTEQTVLLRGLLNESDVKIATALGVALDTVKKAWRRAYERAALVTPYLFEYGDLPGSADEHRGKEKRRHLLEYLRTHLEELRPFDHAGR
jgi:DNA-binding CsgD family transcriptional regulator